MASSAAERWERQRTFHHSLYPAARIAAERQASVSVCLPSRECAATVGEIVGRLGELLQAGAIDEIVVVDAASLDGTAGIAERAGARVVQEARLMPSLGPVLGKGDAMWRALSVLDGDLVAFLDADTEGFSAHFAAGLLGPLVCETGVEFVKAFYRRPFQHGGISLPEGGGRVNHLMARPALKLLYPDLAGVRQPLAGEVAARRELLERIPFATGYGVEIAMLIDVWREVGLEGMAQVDLEEHRNRHQPIEALSKMAEAVLSAIVTRVAAEGRLSMEGMDRVAPGMPGRDLMDLDGVGPQAVGAPVERPPLAELRTR
jgi:glucosyl-3-phosphoglycerate synthase